MNLQESCITDPVKQWQHKHTQVTVRTEGEYHVARCGVCGEDSDYCDDPRIARRNLSLTDFGGFRP